MNFIQLIHAQHQSLSQCLGGKKLENSADCQCYEKRPKTQKRLKRTVFNWTKQDKKTSFSSYVQQKNRKTNNSLSLYQMLGGWQKETS